ncbi:MAG: stage 0 sporulation protein [Clostridia bacterium]|nr:stage 0 sporulation protein [Clostridia bacterium]MDE7328960.1 stage 0 sporulation protein [Clostridia bacterium]
MPMIVGVKFGQKSCGKQYFFDPLDITFEEGEGAIVETARGLELVRITQANTFVSDEDIKTPLKPVVRKATADDEQRVKENLEKREGALKLCQKCIDKRGLKMKLVDAEYSFDRSKITFSFTADGRVDFRELVKDMASKMRMRIELRQIYERDDIRIKGAMGACGRECCCISHLCDYEKATVKMAKNQNLSLNPTKVSGMCGKLMCCLKYENDFYVEANKKLPKVGALVKVNEGQGRVEETDLLKERIKVSIERNDGVEQNYYQVGEFEVLSCPKGCGKKESVSDEADESELAKLED